MVIKLDSDVVALNLLHHIPLFNLLVINLKDTFSGPSVAHTLILIYIQNPYSVITGDFKFYTVKNNDYYESSTYTLPGLEAGSFGSVKLNVDHLQTQFPYANFSISFTTSKYIPAGSSIKVAFPVINFDFRLAYCTDLSFMLIGFNYTLTEIHRN